MIWVGGGIIVHGLAAFGISGPEHVIHDVAVAAAHAVPALHGPVEWAVGAAGSGLFGLAVGTIAVLVLHAMPRRRASESPH